jgi:hypothetical protein
MGEIFMAGALRKKTQLPSGASVTIGAIEPAMDKAWRIWSLESVYGAWAHKWPICIDNVPILPCIKNCVCCPQLDAVQLMLVLRNVINHYPSFDGL